MEQFINDVAKMREAQKEYFRNGTMGNLLELRRREAIVDKKLKGLQRSEKVPKTNDLFNYDNL